MAYFLTGHELNSEIDKIFESAENHIILISPYIKLHKRYESTLLPKKNNPNLQIIVVFGKNEDDMSKSMKEDDFIFFKDFPNIEIRYEKRLHAKYYSNEKTSILTSMNLYDYSQDVNIEAGIIFYKTSLLGKLKNTIMEEESIDKPACAYFDRVIEQSELLFKKVPKFENKNFGLSKKYLNSNIEEDKLTDFFANRQNYDNDKRRSNYDKNRVGYVHTPNTIAQESSNIKRRDNSNTRFLSATALSKELGISAKDLAYKIEKLNWIERRDNTWVLTSLGISKGAEMKKGQYGDYIAYPETVIKELMN